VRKIPFLGAGSVGPTYSGMNAGGVTCTVALTTSEAGVPNSFSPCSVSCQIAPAIVIASIVESMRTRRILSWAQMMRTLALPKIDWVTVALPISVHVFGAGRALLVSSCRLAKSNWLIS
jgi:hypothetical protein